jgi:LCP family protein required for cell wall assembly
MTTSQAMNPGPAVPMVAARRRSRRYLRRALRATGAFVMVMMLTFVGLTAAWLHGVRLPFASGKTIIRVQKFAYADYEGEPSGVVFVLLLGSDFRPGLGGRADAIHVLAVNTKLHRGTILNIPRDTCAAIPGNGTQKINAALAYGGPTLQAQTINQLLGIHLTYSVLLNFASFGAMVNGVGGVTINVATRMNDVYSGAYFQPGLYHVDGGGALAFVRDRHDFPNSDITRTFNQGYFILQAMAQIRHRASTPAGAFGLLALLGRNATLTNISLPDLYRLGRLAQSINPANIANATIPVGSGTCLPLLPNAPSVFADFRDTGIVPNS